MPVPDPQHRISDAERHDVAEVLREAAGEGRLDVEELGERLEATYAAKTYADLVPIVADLPGGGPGARSSGQVASSSAGSAGGPGSPAAWNVPPADVPTHTTSLAVLSGQDRKGVWAVGSHHQAFALMGGVTLDLRQAVFTEPEVVITANVVMGGVDVVVNARTHVVVEGMGVMGAFDQARDKIEPDLGPASPVVRVRGVAIMGGVTVTRKRMPGEPRQWRKELGR